MSIGTTLEAAATFSTFNTKGSKMSKIRNLANRFYEIVNGEGDLSEVLSDDFQFDIMKGFPFGGIQDGLAETNRFFENLGPLFDVFEVHPTEFIPLDETNLIVKGFYRATGATSGKKVDIETVHFWTSNGEKLNGYKHYCDTGLLCDILGHEMPSLNDRHHSASSK